ncbi:hypothetical protein FB567DRAFT_545158 [Paraphoma chrysanthemicola]|uniref:Rhodopsin domain-containing protein n=1 Tax=Paraphoma chrysanthemicola TaxID=798071 RepID=A0A8K0RCW4_9PLEO|nr:hypothetical protein FB567DRAFT_545158 [Paraphoma chrysanthemicola]
MSSRQNYITEDHLLNTTYGMLTLTSVFVIARTLTTQVLRPKRWLPQDAIIYVAYILYIILAVLYIVVTPILFRLTAVGEKRMKPYPTLRNEHKLMVRIFFVNTMFFWLVLWTVKLSFLMLYKRLIEGLHNIYIKLWWASVVIWFLSLVGSLTSHMTACSSMRAWFTPGACQTPRDIRSQIASLYFTYAVDVLTDLMIMALPIRIIWNLKMPQTQKFGITGLFGIGIILIAVATLRVAQIGGKAQSISQPSASWLALWGVIETSIAVIIGCCPAFVTLIRNHTTPAVSYNAQGFVRQSEGGRSRENASDPDSVKLNSLQASQDGRLADSSTKSTSSKDVGWQGFNGTRFEDEPPPRDVVEELIEETPMGKKRIKVRRGAR